MVLFYFLKSSMQYLPSYPVFVDFSFSVPLSACVPLLIVVWPDEHFFVLLLSATVFCLAEYLPSHDFTLEHHFRRLRLLVFISRFLFPPYHLINLSFLLQLSTYFSSSHDFTSPTCICVPWCSNKISNLSNISNFVVFNLSRNKWDSCGHFCKCSVNLEILYYHSPKWQANFKFIANVTQWTCAYFRCSK